MRKNFAKVCLLSVAVTLLFAACAREDFKSTKSEGKVFTATIGQLTRTSLDANETGVKVNWVAGDEIIINGVKYVAAPDASDATMATFTKKNESDADPEPVDGKYYAYYGCGNGILPETQFYSADGANAPMYAESESTVLDFNNICALLEITLKGTETVSSIIVSSSNLATSGSFTVADGQTAVLSTSGSILTGVTLNCGDGIALTAEGTKFYVVVPAGNYEALNIKAIAKDGLSWSKATANTAVVESSKLYRLEFTPEFAEHYVAQIGDMKFNDIEQAFMTANGSGAVTIKMLDDVLLSNSLFFENIEGNVITLDMNSKTIIAAEKAFDVNTSANIVDNSAEKKGKIKAGTYAIYAVKDGITMNISDVEFEGAAQYGAARLSGNESVFNISGKAYFNNVATGQTSNYAGIHIGVSSKSNTPTVNISGGKFNSVSTYGIRCKYGKVNVTGGTFMGAIAAFNMSDGGNNAATVTGGYFSNTDEASPVIYDEKGKMSGAVSGGVFNKAIGKALLSPGYECAPYTYSADGIDYHFNIVESDLPAAYVTIGGNTTGYETYAEAFAATTAANSDVTMKLMSSVDLEGVQDFTNVNGKSVTVDLNGYNITGTTTKTCFIKTSGNLTLTDNSSDTPGTISSNGFRVVDPAENAVINIKKVSVTSSRSGAGYTGADSSMIVVPVGATVNISDNATIYRTAKSYKLFYVAGTLNIGESRLYVGNKTDGAYNLLFAVGGSTVTINEGACLRTYSDKTGMVRSGDNTAKIIINGGYFYADVVFAAGTANFAEAFQINGGYYKSAITAFDPVAEYANFGNGKSLQAIDPKATYQWDSETLSFEYAVK